VLSQFQEVWSCDFEFETGGGKRPLPVSFVGKEFHSGRVVRLFHDELMAGARPPIDFSSRKVLYVAFSAPAELGCHRALGWPMPARTLDLYFEFRRLLSGLPKPFGSGLLGCMQTFGLQGMDAAEKKDLQVAIGSGAWRELGKQAVLDYNEVDVTATDKLLPLMIPHIGNPASRRPSVSRSLSAMWRWV
jgi:DNA polymerase-1